jgi:endonuclease/exonuclease/phosphatase family metal-dependent hydrolase
VSDVAADLHVMSFNIRRRMPHVSHDHPDRWQYRAPRIAALLQRERPALLGVQEAMPDQAALVTDALGVGYRQVGVGRNADGGGEATPIYLDERRLELLEWSQSALSDRPDEPGSRGWGAPVPRVLVSATVRDRGTGLVFLALNAHFDAFSPWARVRSAALVRQRVAAAGMPAIVTGDLNAGPRSAAIIELLAGGLCGTVGCWRSTG